MKKIALILICILISTVSFSQTIDSTHYKQYVIDRNYFIKLQETVESKNQYIGLQWCIDLLNKYIQLEEMQFKQENENGKR